MPFFPPRALTGLLACAIGGMTIHAFSGVGLGKGSREDLLATVLKAFKPKVRWERAKVLIIDESELSPSPSLSSVV